MNDSKKRDATPPRLAVLEGGDEIDRVCNAILDEIIQPRATDTAKVDALYAKLAPRGKLALVPKPGTEGGGGS